MRKMDNELDLVICGLQEIDGTLDERVTHVLSILDPGTPEPARFAELPDDQLLRLRFHDVIEEYQPLSEAPQQAHIAAILKFGEEAARAHHRILIHCHMGVSRSTAAAVMLLAKESGDAEAAMARVAELRPIAWPNLRMIELADENLALGRSLVHAVRRHHARVLLRRPHLREAFALHGRAREVEGLDGLA
jgi:predicted protein tyrosine phosphatase